MLLVLLTLLFSLAPISGAVLTNAHAHNDYLHARPLFDALHHGFCSVEADIHLVNRELLVGHDLSETRPGRTLKKLYLEPLNQIARTNGNRIIGKGTFFLLVDIKSAAGPTFEALHLELREYEPMLTRFPNGQANAVTVILSGNRPLAEVRAQSNLLVAIDGRLDETALVADLPRPLVSDNWKKFFSWDGRGDFPPDQKEKLRSLVKRVHSEGRKIRFWGAPDHEAGWSVLLEAGVDLINTDKLGGLEEFLARGAGLVK